MAINFPDSPSTNDTHTVGDKTWTWNATYWHLNQNSSTYYAQDGVPSSSTAGDFWFESDSGQLFVRYDSAWVEIGHATDFGSSMSDADGDTLIQLEEASDEDIIRFDTGGTERMTITAAGKVGIGATPNNTLDVIGDLFVGDTSRTYAGAASYGGLCFPRGEILFSNTNAQDQLYFVSNATMGSDGGWDAINTGEVASMGLDNGTFVVQVAGSTTAGAAPSYTTALHITNGGNVGFGTSSQTYRFQVAHTGNSNQGYFEGGWVDNLNSNSRLIFNDNNFGIGAGQIGSGSNEDDLVLWAYSGAGRGISFKGTSAGSTTTFQSMDAWMRITGGKVGIGTTSPTNLLHLSGTDPVLRIDETPGDDDVKLQLMQSGSESEGTELKYESATGHSYLKSIYSGGHMYFQTAGANTRMTIASDGRVAIGTTVQGQVPNLTLGGTGASEGGQLNFAGGSSYGNELYLDRYGNNLRMIYNGASVFEVESTGSLTFLDTAQLKCGSGNDLLIYANGSNSFIDHNGDGDLWIRTGAAGEHMYFNTLNGGTGSNIIFQRNSVTTLELRYGSTTHEGSGNNSNNTYGAVGFAAAGVFLDRHWLGNPGFTVCNANAAGNTAQGTFRFHGSNHSWASYPAVSGSDFGCNVVCDGTFSPTSDERRKTDIEDITGALATVNALQGRTYRFKNSDLVAEDPGTIGGKLYGLIAQEAKDFLPHAIWDDGEEPLENGWCRSMRLDYTGMTAVLVEAIKELTTRLETLESA